MRGLLGDFTTMPLKDLVVYLGNKRASGTLKFERDDVRKQALLVEGCVVNASSTQRREYLGQFIINMGHLTEDQFNKAYLTQRETKIFLGKILVMIGLVSEDVVRSALSMKLRETLLDAFNWTEGTFTFDAEPPAPRMEGLDVKVDLLDIVREGEFRETAWQAIRAVFPSGDVQLRVDESKLPEPPKPGSIDAQLVALMREGATLDEMVLALHATDFFLYQRLYALYRQDAVRVVEDVFSEPTRPAAEPTAAPAPVATPDSPSGAFDITVEEEEEPSAEELVSKATMSLAMGDAKEAEALARKAFELSPTPEAVDLLRKAEAALGGQLKAEMLERRRVPQLLVPPSQLKTMELTAQEKYLLSRIDGMRDVGAIVEVSPLQELEALKLFQRFVDSGLVRLS